MRRRIFSICIILVMLLQSACTLKNEVPAAVVGNKSFQEKGVTITDKGNYFDVVIDFSSGLSHYEIGAALARGIIKAVPNYEALVDSYIAESVSKYDYRTMMNRVDDLKVKLDDNYKQEIEGMASVFTGGEKIQLKDDKISQEEFYLFNLFPDVYRLSACSFVSVYGSRSETNNNIIARNLDWFGGTTNQLTKIHSIVTMRYPDKSVVSIGFLGFMGVLTGINDSKIFGSILDSRTGAPFVSTGKNSYTYDLRTDLVNAISLNDAVDFMKSQDRQYTFNHIVCFADEEKSVVLENNFSGRGSDGQRVQRAVRTADSELNKDIEWGISNAVGSVNSFILYGNSDNHTPNDFNTLRWDSMREQLLSKGSTVSFDEMKEISSYSHGTPGTFNESGDLYNKLTIQMVVFEPKSSHLEVFFRPVDSLDNPVKPIYEKIKLFN